ncbi:MAG: hypothetical protein ACK5YF_05715, partial [Rhodobacterales bacterium]
MTGINIAIRASWCPLPDVAGNHHRNRTGTAGVESCLYTITTVDFMHFSGMFPQRPAGRAGKDAAHD